jgi:hypothetical protein
MKNSHVKAWALFLLGLGVGAIFYGAFPEVRETALVLAWVAGCWGLTHFLHQHYLERARFFCDLFNRFNERYNEMNNRLDLIVNGSGIVTREERGLIVDYFNLCAEEYVFHQRGYIPDDIWFSWRNGMKWYAAKERVLKVWREEKETESYYGFDLENP